MNLTNHPQEHPADVVVAGIGYKKQSRRERRGVSAGGFIEGHVDISLPPYAAILFDAKSQPPTVLPRAPPAMFC